MSPSALAESDATTDGAMTHRQVLEALSGLLLGMFVSILAGTVVSTSLPLIIADLGGDQAAFTWVVTATLLATTVSTPIWGKLADLFDRKLLLQLALSVFVLGSALAGFSQDPSTLIGFRVLQGLGAGGLAALSQIVMADIISPRERGRYAGLFGGVMAVGTVGGPLLGGVVTDAFGWRWNFFIALPVALLAIVLLQRTLHLPKRDRRRVSIDYLGFVLISGGVSLLLVWVTLAGSSFEWASPTSFAMVAGALALLVAAVFVELRSPDPMIPMTMFRDRTFTLSVVASLAVGVAMFGTAVFLSQYMQLARGATPTQSGLLTIPMMAGVLIASSVFGSLISRTGRWKAVMVTGSSLTIAGLLLLSFLHYDTPFWYVGGAMFVLGSGVGMVMQNLVLVVQNAIEVRNLGVATSAVTFFRSLGGTIGVSVLGAVLGHRVATDLGANIAALPGDQQMEAARTLASGTIPHISSLPEFLRVPVEAAYGTGVGTVFLCAVPLAVISLVAIVFLPRVPLGTRTAQQRLADGDRAGETDEVAGLDDSANTDEPDAGTRATTPVPAAVAADTVADRDETTPAGRTAGGR